MATASCTHQEKLTKGDTKESMIPKEVLEHDRVQELIKGENDRKSGTIVVVLNVRKELLDELLQTYVLILSVCLYAVWHCCRAYSM